MTDKQRISFYFPAWRDLAIALDWRMVDGRLLANLDEQLQGAASWPEHARVVVVAIIGWAQTMAARERRAVNAEDLRHACNQTASGRNGSAGHTSSSKLSNADLNQFVRQCAILRNPWDTNLTPMIAWCNPEEDNRKRTLQYLRKLANEGRLIAIARNAWGTGDWESLSQGRLDALIAEIKKSAWTHGKRFTRRQPMIGDKGAKKGQPF